MRRKTPQRVFLAPDFPEVQPVRRDVLQLAKRAAGSQGAEFADARMVLQQVAHHQDAPAIPGQADQFLRLGDIEAKRLLDEHILAGLERPLGQAVMQFRRRRDGHAGDFFVRENRLRIGARFQSGVLGAEAAKRLLVGVAEPAQHAQLMKIPRQVPPPVTGPDQGQVAWLLVFAH